MNTIFNVIDNSGAQQLLYIGSLQKNSSKIRIGTIIMGVVKKVKKNSLVKLASIVRALIVMSRTFFNIQDGSYIKFCKNSVILLTKKNTPIGNRILEPFYYKKLYYKILKINSII